jgi:hypothetical protein
MTHRIPAAEELDGLVALQRRAKKAMLDEAKRHAEYRLGRSCPGLGPVRTAELLPIVVTPLSQSHRGKRRFNRVARADVYPVLRRKIEEREPVLKPSAWELRRLSPHQG